TSRRKPLYDSGHRTYLSEDEKASTHPAGEQLLYPRSAGISYALSYTSLMASKSLVCIPSIASGVLPVKHFVIPQNTNCGDHGPPTLNLHEMIIRMIGTD